MSKSTEGFRYTKHHSFGSYRSPIITTLVSDITCVRSMVAWHGLPSGAINPKLTSSNYLVYNVSFQPSPSKKWFPLLSC